MPKHYKAPKFKAVKTAKPKERPIKKPKKKTTKKRK